MATDPFLQRPIARIGFITVMAFGWTSIILLPIQIDAYVRVLGLPEATAALLASAEVAALALAALGLSVIIDRLDKRLLCTVACMVIIAANLVSLGTGAGPLLIAMRLFAGAGFGAIVAATNAVPSQTASSGAMFRWSQFAVGLFGFVILVALPLLAAWPATQALFLLEIAAGVIALLCCSGVPAARRAKASSAAPMPLTWRIAGGLFSIFAFFLAQTCIWGFTSRVSSSLAMNAHDVELLLAVSLLIGVAGAVAAMVLAERWRFIAPFTLGYCGVALFGWLIYAARDQAGFAFGLLAVNFFIIFATPYILDVLGRCDPQGRVAAAGGAFINFGCAAAPFISGLAVSRMGYQSVGWISAALLAAGLLAIWPAARMTERQLG
ncbi:MAG: hypothetical protein H3C55_13795 [Pseudorhodoplanes sp.]|nr:hypothetical protein [Pseudorhodoplanes sp.]